MTPVELFPDVFAADYVGEPGNRTFYLQCRGAETRTYLLEKQQVTALAERLSEILMRVDPTDTLVKTPPGRDPHLRLVGELDEAPRIDSMALGHDDSNDRLIIVIETGDEETEEDALHVSLRRDQARAFVLHAMAVVAEGRELCPLCGLPIDVSGHDCPARNGHRGGG